MPADAQAQSGPARWGTPVQRSRVLQLWALQDATAMLHRLLLQKVCIMFAQDQRRWTTPTVCLWLRLVQAPFQLH